MVRLIKYLEGKPRSVIWHLLAFAMALYLPVVGLSAVLAYSYVQTEQAELKHQALATARSFEGTVQSRVQALQASARALATSRPLRDGEYEDFYQQARQAVVGDGEWVVLTAPDRTQLVNTLLPYGTPLPKNVSDGLDGVLAGQDYLSNIHRGPVAGQNVFHYSVPVWNNGKVTHILSVAALTSSFTDLAIKEASGWQVALVGSDQRIIARNPHPETAGGLISETTQRELQIGPKPGVDYLYAKPITSVTGQTIIGGFRRMTNGWTIFVAIGEEEFLRPVWRAIWAGGLLTLIFVLIPPLFAILFGMRITSAIDALVRKANHLAAGEVVEPPITSLKEINLAADAMHRAAKKMKAENAHQQILLQELNHRVKNTLASIQAIARRTFTGKDRESYGRFEGRILALSATHNLLTQQSWAGADIKDIIEAELAPYKNIETIGKSILLPSRVAVSLATVFHELATNAATFGALSTPKGQVHLSWTSLPMDGGLAIDIEWMESGGPIVKGPKRKGFGTTLIQTSIQHELQGTVEMHYFPSGLCCMISLLVFEETMLDPATEKNAA